MKPPAGSSPQEPPSSASVCTHLADTLPDTPIGVAVVDAAGHPGWPGDTPALTIRHPSIRGCLPRVDGLEPEIPRA